MSWVFLLSSISMSYSILLMITYFAKKRLKIRENIIYEVLIVINFVEIILEILLDVVGPLYQVTPFLSFLIARLYSSLLLSWIVTLCMYIALISLDMKGKERYFKKIKNYFFVILIVCIALIFYLPLNFYYGNNAAYTYGPSINVVYMASFLFTFIGTAFVMWNIKNFKDKRFFPLIIFLFVGGVCSIIQYYNPELLLATIVHSFITFLMYFTIENPDMKMVEELIDNRKIIERTSEEKSVFLFKMSQGIRIPVNNIDSQIDLYSESRNNIHDVDNIIDTIDVNNKKINYLINDVLGVNSFDINTLRKYNTTYNVYSLLNGIKVRTKGMISSDVDYHFSIASSMPKELYGDGIKLKQVLMACLACSIKNTRTGFINVDVNSFTRYDVCRLVISIEDSGTNISAVDINNILNQDAEITEQESYRLEKSDIDLSLAYKVVKSLGGTMYIKSEKDKGVEITITIDQYIVENEEIKNNSNVDSYIKSRRNIKRVLVVDDEEEEIRKIKKILESRGYDIVTSMYGKDAVDRIRNKEKYDIILIDDEMPLMNGINVLQEMNKLKDKSKKIVLLGRDKLFIAKHYIEDGFDDFIDKEKLIKEIEEKIK